MSTTFLVRHTDGTYTRERPEDVLPEDQVVFDGPGSTAAIDAAGAALREEIEAAGGLEEWRAASVSKGQYKRRVLMQKGFIGALRRR